MIHWVQCLAQLQFPWGSHKYHQPQKAYVRLATFQQHQNRSRTRWWASIHNLIAVWPLSSSIFKSKYISCNIVQAQRTQFRDMQSLTLSYKHPPVATVALASWHLQKLASSTWHGQTLRLHSRIANVSPKTQNAVSKAQAIGQQPISSKEQWSETTTIPFHLELWEMPKVEQTKSSWQITHVRYHDISPVGSWEPAPLRASQRRIKGNENEIRETGNVFKL